MSSWTPNVKGRIANSSHQMTPYIHNSLTFPTPMARSMFTTNTILKASSSSPSSWEVKAEIWDLVLDKLQQVYHFNVYLWTQRLAYGHLVLQFVEVVHGCLLSWHVPGVQQCLVRWQMSEQINNSSSISFWLNSAGLNYVSSRLDLKCQYYQNKFSSKQVTNEVTLSFWDQPHPGLPSKVEFYAHVSNQQVPPGYKP